MFRAILLLLLGAGLVPDLSGGHDALDPAFEKVPFEQWLGEHDQLHLRWTADVPRAELSFHQRLAAGVEVTVDGRDLESRRGAGRLVFLVQITDRAGTRYQNHGSVELSRLDQNIRAANLQYSQRAFVLPGDYRLAVAILDTATGEHSTRQMPFRVAPLTHDPLPGLWGDLPPVEFIGNAESPDSWYLPDIHGGLKWAPATAASPRVNVILNVAPSEPARGSRHSQSGDLAALLPTLKAISQSGSSSRSVHVELLDLARRHAVFHQNEVHELDCRA